MSKAAGDPNPCHTPLPSSAQTEDIKKGETETGRWMHCIRRDGGRWAKAGLKVTVSRCKKTPSRKYPPALISAQLVFMFCVTLKCQQHPRRQGWIVKKAEGGRDASFVKTMPLCCNMLFVWIFQWVEKEKNDHSEIWQEGKYGGKRWHLPLY